MPHLRFSIHSTIALVAVGDPSRDRTVYATIVLLVALGFTMIMLAVWLLRRTRPDPEVLAPLERMGERKWRRADPVWQRRHLDQVRPGGADPLEPTSAPPATDADFERGPQPIGFDDLVVSSTTSVATATGLPAPSGDVPSDDGPPVVGNGDGPAQGEGEAIGITPDDVEDITGEQDTDDFLAVLEHESELEHDVDPVVEPESGAEPDDDPEARSDLDTSGEPVVETASDSDIDPVAPVDTEADVDPDRDPDVDHAGEPGAVPGIALDVDDDERPDIEADSDALNDPVEVPEAQPDVDLDIGDDDEPG